MSQLALQSNAKDMMGSATLSAVRGQGSKGSGAPKRGAGSVGLVADLSNKLARQRKQLDELVAAQAAKKSTWKWYHVLGLILLNNLVVMAIGITAGSAFYGVGPIAEGSFKSGMIKTEGLQVMADEGHQQVVFESTVGTADLTIKAANGFDSTILFAGKDEAARFSMVASGEDYFAIRSSDGRDRISLTQGVTGESELRMDPMGGELVRPQPLPPLHAPVPAAAQPPQPTAAGCSARGYRSQQECAGNLGRPELRLRHDPDAQQLDAHHVGRRHHAQAGRARDAEGQRGGRRG